MPPFWPPRNCKKEEEEEILKGESSQCKSGSCYDTIYYPLLFCTRKKFLSKRFILTAAQQLLFFFRSSRALRLRLLLADMNVEQGKAIYLGPHENPQKKRKVTISKDQNCMLCSKMSLTLEFLVTVHKAKSKGSHSIHMLNIQIDTKS